MRGAGRLTSLTLEAAEIVEPPRIRIIRFRILGPLEVQAPEGWAPIKAASRATAAASRFPICAGCSPISR